MKNLYIAVGKGDWSKGDNIRKALSGVEHNADFDEIRLIVATFPDDDTPADDIIYHANGSYSLTGRATAEHFDGLEIVEYMKNLMGVGA